MECFRQEYWSRWPLPTPGNLPNPEIDFTSLAFPALASGFFTTSITWEAPQKGAEDLNKHLSKKERDGQKSHDKMHNTVRTGFGISKKKAPDSTKFFQEFKKN